jgi:hypothetical protein
MLAGTHCRHIPLNGLGQLEVGWTLHPSYILLSVQPEGAPSISKVRCYVDAFSSADELFDGMLWQQPAK